VTEPVESTPGPDAHLSPCPFCGTSERDDDQSRGLDDWPQLSVQPGRLYCVECFGCGVETRWFESAAEAIAAWNRHACAEPWREADVATQRYLLTQLLTLPGLPAAAAVPWPERLAAAVQARVPPDTRIAVDTSGPYVRIEAARHGTAVFVQATEQSCRDRPDDVDVAQCAADKLVALLAEREMAAAEGE
jgi:hypothetical protein